MVVLLQDWYDIFEIFSLSDFSRSLILLKSYVPILVITE